MNKKMIAVVAILVVVVWLFCAIIAWRAHSRTVHETTSTLYFVSRFGMWATFLINPLFAIVPVEVG